MLRKALALTLITAGFGALWMGFAQTASAGESHPRVCAAGEVYVADLRACVDRDSLGDVLGDVGDTVEDLLDDLGDAVGDLL